MSELPIHLSKARIAAFEQCPQRLWLMTRRPEQAQAGEGVRARLTAGNVVGAEACRLYPAGVMVEAEPHLAAALATTRTLVEGGHNEPIFEATFEHKGVLVRIDLLEPHDGGWRIVEVKSSCKVKPVHERDLEAKQKAKENGETTSLLVFPGRDGGRLWNFEKAMATAVKTAGVLRNDKPMHINPHLLRKANATWLKQRGTDDSLLQPRLGHAPGSRVTAHNDVHLPTEAVRET